MKLINLFDEIINDNISENVVFKMYGERFEGINELGYEKGLSRELLLGEVELIEDTLSKLYSPKEEKKIEDKARFQRSQIPPWFNMKELIKVVNENFEKHQNALNEIIDKINGE